MLPLETKQSGGKLLPHSDLWGGVFLRETPRGFKDYRQKHKTQKEQHKYKISTWNVRTLNQDGKLENLKKEMQKNAVSVLGVSEVRWKSQGEIRSGDYTVYYSGGDRAERGVAHSAKIIPRLLRRRIEKKTEDALGEDQFGFRRGKGTRNAIGMLRIISERTLVKMRNCVLASYTGRRHLTVSTGPN
jgi:hypothetical protein